MTTKQYAEREVDELDYAGGFYSLHVSAMTKENLNSKRDIAAELAFRDFIIAQMDEHIFRLENKVDELLLINGELGEDINELRGERDSLYIQLSGHESL